MSAPAFLTTSVLVGRPKRPHPIPNTLRMTQVAPSATPIKRVRPITAPRIVSANHEEALRRALSRRRKIRRWGLALSSLPFCGGLALSLTLHPVSPPVELVASLTAAVAALSTRYKLELGRDGVAYFSRRVPGVVIPRDIEALLEIRPAPGKGLGVFAATQIPRGTCLGMYEGLLLDTAAFMARYPRGSRVGEYVMRMDSQTVRDARDLVAEDKGSILMARLNHASARNANVERVWRRRDRQVLFFATRVVYPGEELCFDYGTAYWTGREGDIMP